MCNVESRPVLVEGLRPASREPEDFEPGCSRVELQFMGQRFLHATEQDGFGGLEPGWHHEQGHEGLLGSRWASHLDVMISFLVQPGAVHPKT